MAWRNVALPLGNLVPSTIDDFSWITDSNKSGSSKVTYNDVHVNSSGLALGYVVGDSNNGLLLSNYSQYQFQANIYFNNTQYGRYYQNPLAPGSSQIWANASISYIAAIDDEQQLGIFTFCEKSIPANNWTLSAGSTPMATAEFYEFITGNIVIPHIWRPIASVGGKLGLFEFSMINEEDIGDGAQVTDASPDTISRFMESTKLASLGTNLFLDVLTEIIYSGDNNSMELYKAYLPIPGLTQFTLYFNIDGTQVYSYSDITTYDDAYLSFVVDDENEVAAISMIYVNYNPTEVTYNYGGLTPSHDLYLWFANNYTVNPDDNGPDPDEGANPWQDEDVPGLDTPTISAIDTGFTSMYVVTDSELRSLAHYLWTSDFVTNIKKLFSDPREIIIGLSMFPVTPDYGSSTNIKAGGIDTGITGKPLTSQYKLLDDFGSIYMQKEKGCFLDYPPFTKITAHLPYVGEHELDVNDIAGKTIKLKYLFDFLTGACVAEIDVNGKPRYFFSGQTGVQIPTSSEDFTRQFTSFLAAGVGIGTALAAPSVGAAAAPIAMTAVNAINAGLSPSVQYSSGGGGVNGFLSTQGAYITIELPENKIAAKQSGFVGKPSYIYADHLSSCKGYIKCFSVHLDGVDCLPGELRDIEQQLLAGVRIEDGSENPTYTPTESGDFGIIFLKMLSDLNVIGKTWDENDELTIEGKIFYEKDITKPVLLISGNISAYNYCYIPHFNRFYHIDEIICKTGTMQEIHTSVDPLQSFKSNLLDCDAILERAEDPNYVNSKFNDAYMWTQQNKRVKTVNFKANGDLAKFDRNNNVYILTIAGG